jgi:hypothetical protein
LVYCVENASHLLLLEQGSSKSAYPLSAAP